MSKDINYYQELLAYVAKLLGTPPATSQPATSQPAPPIPVLTQAQIDKARAEIEGSKPKPVPFSGMSGYSERGTPDTWDTAMGEVYGYRWWYLTLPPEAVGYIDCSPRSLNAGRMNGVLYGANNQVWEDGRAEAYCTASRSSFSFTMDRQHFVHEPPETRGDGCGCGFWAYFNKDLQVRSIISAVAGDTPQLYSFAAAIPVFGVVKGTGRVIIGEKGFRSQYAQIMGLCLSAVALKQLSWWLISQEERARPDPWRGELRDPVKPEKEQCSFQEHATRVSEIEGILATRYPSAKLFSSQELLTRYFPPDKNYA